MPLCSKTGEVKYVKIGPSAYSLVPSVTQIRKNSSGVLTPSSFTVKAMQGNKELADKYIQWWGSTDGVTWSYMNYKYGSGAVITVNTSYTHYLVRLFDYNPPVAVDNATGWLASINVVVVEDGKDGEDGQKGNRGARIGGPTVWSKNGSYTAGVGTEEYISVVLYRENSDEKYIAYECLITHSNRNVTPKDSVAAGDGYWRVSFYQDFIATTLLLAEKIKADMIDADGLVAKNVEIEGNIKANKFITEFKSTNLPTTWVSGVSSSNISVRGRSGNINVVTLDSAKKSNGVTIQIYCELRSKSDDSAYVASLQPTFKYGLSNYLYYKLPTDLITVITSVLIPGSEDCIWVIHDPIPENFMNNI